MPAAVKPTICNSSATCGVHNKQTPAYRNMVRPLGIARNRNAHAHNAKQHVHQRPPGKRRHALLGVRTQSTEDGAPKGNDPGKLVDVVSEAVDRRRVADGVLTSPMEVVARAKGLPKMRPREKEVRWPWPYPFSILLSEGEPYWGMYVRMGGGEEGATGGTAAMGAKGWSNYEGDGSVMWCISRCVVVVVFVR